MTAANAVQWATLLVILAVFLIALGSVLPGSSSFGARIGAVISSGVAFVLYLIAILT